MISVPTRSGSYWPHLAALAAIWAVVVMSPGPDFVVTISRAARSRGPAWPQRPGSSPEPLSGHRPAPQGWDLRLRITGGSPRSCDCWELAT